MGDDPLTVKWWCSWCSKLSIHTLTEENVFARSIYTCGNCHRRTLPCSTCDEAGAEGGDLWDNWFCAVCGGDRDYWPLTRSQPRPLPYQPPVFYGQQANGQQVFYVPVTQLPQGYYVQPQGYAPVMQQPVMQQPVMQQPGMHQPPQQQPVPASPPVQLSAEDEALQRALLLSLEEAKEPSKATSRDALLRCEVERQLNEWKLQMYAENVHLESIPHIREMEERGRITARLITEGYGKPRSEGVKVPPPTRTTASTSRKASQVQEDADMEKAIAESLSLSSKKMFNKGEGMAATNSMSALFGDEEEDDDYGSGDRHAEVTQAASAREASNSTSVIKPQNRSPAAQDARLVVPKPASSSSAASTSSLPVDETSSSSSPSSNATLPAVTVVAAVPALVEPVATKEPNTKVADEADPKPKMPGASGAVSSSAASPAQGFIAVDPVKSRLVPTQLSGADDESDDGSFYDDDDDNGGCVHDAKAQSALSLPAVVPVASSELTAEVVNDEPAIQPPDKATAAAEAEVVAPVSTPSPGANKASSKATVVPAASNPAPAAASSVEVLAAETPKSGVVTGVQAAQCTRQQQSLAQQAAEQVQKRNSISSAATTASVAALNSPAPAQRKASTTENNPFATLKSRDEREKAEATRLLASMGGASPSPTQPKPAFSAPSPAQEKAAALVQSSPKAAAKPAPSPEPVKATVGNSVTPAAAQDPTAASSAASVPVSSPTSFQKVSASPTPEVNAPQQAQRRASTTENNPFATLKSRDEREKAEATRLLASMGGASPSPTRPKPASSAPSPAQEKMPAPVKPSPKAAAKPAPSPEAAKAMMGKKEAQEKVPAAAGQKRVDTAAAPVRAAPSSTPLTQTKVPAVGDSEKSANKQATAAEPKVAEGDANAELSAAARRYMQMTAGGNGNGSSSDEDDE